MPFLSPTQTLSVVQELSLFPADFGCVLHLWHHELVMLFRWTTATAYIRINSILAIHIKPTEKILAKADDKVIDKAHTSMVIYRNCNSSTRNQLLRSGTICLLSSLIGSVVSQWLAHVPLVLEVRGSIPACGDGKFRCPKTLSLVSLRPNMLSLVSLCPNTLSLVPFTEMTINKCTVFQIRELTGCPMCKKSHAHACQRTLRHFRYGY